MAVAPLARSRLRRRAPMRRRRVMRPKYRPTAGVRSKYHAPKSFVETIRVADLVSAPGGSTSTGSVVQTRLAGQSLPNLNSLLSQLYRQFCIRGIKWFYEPTYTEYSAQTGLSMMPKIYTAVDKTQFSTDNLPGNITRIMGQNNSKIFQSNRRWSVYVKLPRPLLTQGNALLNDPDDSNQVVQTLVTPSARATQWLTMQPFLPDDESGETTGLDVQHASLNVLVGQNNTNVSIGVGVLYAKVYYSVKEQSYPVFP